ncbi:MAG: DUF1697 domain-containing protein [Pikeienuella sp.]
MNRWILLLRGVNVGGSNILPMKDLRAALERRGLRDARTYIQSGNCVIDGDARDAAELSALAAGAIEQDFGFRPQVLALTPQQIETAIADNPFADEGCDPKTVHIHFLLEEPGAPDLASLESLRAPSERFHLATGRFYLHAPDGVARSKLAAQAERRLGVPTTARNLRSVMKIAELAR